MSELAPLPPYQTVLRFLDDELSATEVTALADQLRGDATARRQVAALLLQIGLLAEMAREGDGARPPLPPPPPRATRWPLVGIALCAALAVAAFLLVVGTGRTPPRPDPRGPAFARPATRRPLRALAAPDARHALFVHGDDVDSAAGDAVLVRHLEGLGFGVDQLVDADLRASDVEGQDLVVISASALGKVVRETVSLAGLREGPVPVVTCESATFDVLGMTAPRVTDGLGLRNGLGSAPGHTHVEIQAAGHVLAAGLSGIAAVARAGVALSWGVPSRDAVRVATLDTNRELVVQFAYERGAQMVGLRAPARRVACFISAEAGELLTPQGWALFDAGVRWASGR